MLLVCTCETMAVPTWLHNGYLGQFAINSSLSAKSSEEKKSMEQMKREIEKYLQDWNAAMIAADTVRLSTMMDDGIILRHITGMTQTKQEWLEEVAGGSMKYHKIETRNVIINTQGNNSANVSFTSAITATIWGSYGTWTLRGSMKLMKRNGRWIRIN